MSKKKMNSLICLCLLMSFWISMFLNYRSAVQSEASSFSQMTNYMESILNSNIFYEEAELINEANSPAVTEGQCSVEELISAKLQYMISNVNIPYAFGFINTEQKIVAQNKIACFTESHDGNFNYDIYNYVDIESYLTNEHKKSIRKIRKDYPHIIRIGVKTGSDGKHIPTEIIFGNYTAGYSLTEEYSLPLDNGETEKYFSPKSGAFYLNFYELTGNNYEKHVYKELEDELESFADTNHMFHSGGGGFSDADEYSIHCPVTVNGEDYIFYFCAKINLPVRALTSDFMIYLIGQLIIMYAILTVIVLFLAHKIYNKAEKLKKSKLTFISAAAHELKTPLAVIQNQCECILEGAVDNKKDEYIKSVYEEALRMNDIVTSLLTFNRLSSADKIEKESCNLTALVKEEVNKYLPFARSAGAELTLNAENDITVTCNPKLMTLAVDNYLSNAVKYTTGEKKITVTLKAEKDSFTLEVFNTCKPFSKETAENIWNLFERQDASRTRDGTSTGMGLPICKRIFECHGYGYGCQSTDTGIIFTVKGKL